MIMVSKYFNILLLPLSKPSKEYFIISIDVNFFSNTIASTIMLQSYAECEVFLVTEKQNMKKKIFLRRCPQQISGKNSGSK